MNNKHSEFYTRVFAGCIAYALTVVTSGIWGIIKDGWGSTISALFLLEALGLMAAIELVDWLLERLIPNTALFFITEFVVLSAIVVGCGLLFGWIGLSWVNIATTAGIVLVITAAVYLTLTGRNRSDARAINKQLEK